jgi:hypothetical protein
MSRILLSLIFFPLSLFAAAHDLSVCAIFQDDAHFLKEWIEFHKIQGVSHFYLYNNNSSDNYQEALQPYLEKEEVTLVDWDYEYEDANRKSWCLVQTGAYLDCIQKYGEDTRWLAFIDTDEFLFCPDGQPLPNFLKSYESYPAVCANWLMFGTSHVEDIQPGELMIEFLLHCANFDNPVNKHIKSIVQPASVVGCCNAHFFFYADDQCAVNSDFQPVIGPFSEPINLDKIRINHYWTRTERFLKDIKIPRKGHMRGVTEAKILKDARAYNREIDLSILQFVAELREKMGFSSLK